MITMSDIQELGRRIAEACQPERVILFGSYAYGTPTTYSDVDILVILPFEGTGFRKALDILNRVDPAFPVDLLARKPEDVSKRFAEGDPLIREALSQGKVLYERHG
jgi:predicted nucleotidyltransferase